MIGIDYSGVAIAAITAFREDLTRDEKHIENLVRHVILTSLKGYKKKFHREYGEMIIACDSAPYWRKKYFPHYKFKRAKAKEESDIPWDIVHKYMDLTLQELRVHFPYKVISVPGAEADDILGVMAQHMSLESESLIDDGTPTKTVIVSKDKDMGQLLSHPNIQQWNPYLRNFVKLEESAKMYLRRLILTGDVGDGVCNVFSPNDSFFTGTRQKPATEKKMLPMLEAANMLDAAPDEFVKKRIMENTRMIALSMIPSDIRENIISAFNVKPVGNRMSIYQYLISKDMKLLMEDIEDF